MGNVPIRVIKPDASDNGLADYALWSLRTAIKETRQEGTSVPLDLIAYIIHDELAPEEVEALVKHLTELGETIE